MGKKELEVKDIDGADWSGTFNISADEYQGKLAPDLFGLLRADAFLQFAQNGKIQTISDRCELSVEQVHEGMITITSAHKVKDIKDAEVSFVGIIKNTENYDLTGITVNLDVRQNTLKTINRRILEPGDSFEIPFKLRFN